MFTLASVLSVGGESTAALQPDSIHTVIGLEDRPTIRNLLDAHAFASSAPFVLFDRHLEKNGGFSMHLAMEKSTTPSANASKHCAKLFGYQIGENMWPEMGTLLQANENVCVDGHSPVPGDWLARARALAVAKPCAAQPCAADGWAVPPRVLTTLRIRKPTDHYHSFYEWDQVPRMNKKWATNKTLVEYIAMTPDLQANILLDSNRAVLAQHRQGEAQPLNSSACTQAMAVASSVDLLTTTEAMSDVWPVLRELTGLALPEEHFHENAKSFGCCGPAVDAMAIDEVEEATRLAAPCDWKLFQMARDSTDKMLQDWKAAQAEKSEAAQ